MAYNGYLVKVGSYTIPFTFITKGYKCGIKGQDLDSYTDSNGILQRNALENVAIKLEWNTGAIAESDFRTVWDIVRAQYLNSTEKKASVKAYMPEIGAYVTMNCYAPDIEFIVDYADETDIEYSSIRIAFIGYGGTV